MHKKFTIIFSSLLLLLSMSEASAQDFSTKEWLAASHDKPLIFYISGDGGFNKFSTQLCQSLNKNGYDVCSLNAKSYFDDKKTPEQTTTDISSYLDKQLAGRPNQQVAIIGYSFGADVLPFVLNRFSERILQKVTVSFIMSSSGSTDFETHWSDMLGGHAKRSMDVVSEINKITSGNIVILNGSDDNDLALNKITLKKYTHEVLPGGHHYDGATDQIAGLILKYIK